MICGYGAIYMAATPHVFVCISAINAPLEFQLNMTAGNPFGEHVFKMGIENGMVSNNPRAIT